MWILGLNDGKDYLINLEKAVNVGVENLFCPDGTPTFQIQIECTTDNFRICFKKECNRDEVFKTIITALWFPQGQGIIDLRKEMSTSETGFEEGDFY